MPAALPHTTQRRLSHHLLLHRQAPDDLGCLQPRRNQVSPTQTMKSVADPVSATGQVPSMGNFGLIDADTPESAYTYTSMETGEVWDLVSALIYR
jgi:hypothetical protein